MKAKILVVEADQTIRKLIRAVLESEDYCVIEAEDQASCLQRVASNDIELVILDCLEQTSRGLTALKRLRWNYQSCSIPIIAMTGLGQYSYDLGILATSCLVKPFRSAHLISKVEAALKRKKILRTDLGLKDAPSCSELSTAE